MMVTSTSEAAIQTLQVTETVDIEAPIDTVFETLLEEIGPLNEAGPGSPLPMKFEPWPGGRWYRDLGNDAGHLWGHVQVIKPPTLLEICVCACTIGDRTLLSGAATNISTAGRARPAAST